MPSTSKKKTTKSKTSTGALQASWTATPISTPQEYINSVAISQNGSTVVAGTFYFPYAAGAKHSNADVSPITQRLKACTGLQYRAMEHGRPLPACRRLGRVLFISTMSLPGREFPPITPKSG